MKKKDLIIRKKTTVCFAYKYFFSEYVSSKTKYMYKTFLIHKLNTYIYIYMHKYYI